MPKLAENWKNMDPHDKSVQILIKLFEFVELRE